MLEMMVGALDVSEIGIYDNSNIEPKLDPRSDEVEESQQEDERKMMTQLDEAPWIGSVPRGGGACDEWLSILDKVFYEGVLDVTDLLGPQLRCSLH